MRIEYAREAATWPRAIPVEQLAFAKACDQRARAAGLHSTPGVYAWADCAILLGAYFFNDPYYQPLYRILVGSSPFDEPERIERAQAWLTDYLPRARG